MLKTGDYVSVIDEFLEGEVVFIEGNLITVRTKDNFDLKFLSSELVKISKDTEMTTSSHDIFKGFKEKEITKNPRTNHPVKLKRKQHPPMEIDLHIEKITTGFKGMTNYDMLTLQLDVAKRNLEFAISKRIPRIVFIHGVGQGVLKEELKYLFRRYDQVKVSEADYKKYGMGAMEVYILQNVK